MSKSTTAPAKNKTGFKGTPWSRTQYYRRKRRAEKLGCSMYDIPDMRGRHHNGPKGNTHPNWNRGVMKNKGGYRLVRVGKDHPLGQWNGYALEHHMVWLSSGKEIPECQVLHHVNGDREDNRLTNLELMANADHSSLHSTGRKRRVVLTKREREVLTMLADGCNTTADIANARGVHRNTVQIMLTGMMARGIVEREWWADRRQHEFFYFISLAADPLTLDGREHRELPEGWPS